MANFSQLRITIGFCVILAVILEQPFTAEAVVRKYSKISQNQSEKKYCKMFNMVLGYLLFVFQPVNAEILRAMTSDYHI